MLFIKHMFNCRCRGLFDLMDDDKNGTIEANELRDALQIVYPDKEFSVFAVRTFIAIADKNGSGKIEYFEFYQLCSHAHSIT